MSSIRGALKRGAGLLVAVGLLLGASAVLAGPAEATYYPKPVLNGHPIIEGAPVVGSVLTVTPGHWLAEPPLFYSYAWRDSVNSLLSATRQYTPTKKDIGQVITVRVTAMDGNNHSSSTEVSTPAITVSDVVSTVKPKLTGGLAVGDTLTLHPGKFTSGSGALTYTYTWTRTDGSKKTPLSDTGTTHTITKADLGLYVSVAILAKSPTQQGSATARTPGAIVPAAPASSDAGLTSSNQGSLSGSVSSTVVTLKDPSGASGDHVFVYGYSSPTQLGWFALGIDKKFTVNIAGLTAGSHKLSVQDESGKLIGWVQVTRAGPSLAGTGNNLIAIGAAVVLVVITVVLIVTARMRRRTKARRH